MTNFTRQIDQGIQNDNGSSSLNGAEAFLNDINANKNANNTIIGHLNINSFRNLFPFAEKIIQVFHIFLVSESELDNTFPTNLFKVNGFKIFLGVTEIDLEEVFCTSMSECHVGYFKDTLIFPI